MSKRDILAVMDDIERRALGGILRSEFDPLIHSWRWVQLYPYSAKSEAEIWRDDFEPVAKWTKQKTQSAHEEAE
jgi:hypothetical protein